MAKHYFCSYVIKRNTLIELMGLIICNYALIKLMTVIVVLFVLCCLLICRHQMNLSNNYH